MWPNSGNEALHFIDEFFLQFRKNSSLILFIPLCVCVSVCLRVRYNSTWCSFGMDIDRMLASTGFCPTTFVKHKEYVGKPVVLDISRLKIRYKRDVYGVPHFVFFEMLDTPLAAANGDGGAVMALRYIPDVVVYCE